MSPTSRPRLPRIWSVWSRFAGSVLVAGVVRALLPSQLHFPIRYLCVWNAGMLTFLFWTWGLMMTATPEVMLRHAQREDAGRWVISSLITAVAFFSVLAIVFLLQNKNAMTSLQIFRIALAGLTIIGSWLLAHTIFASHYAHLYYQGGNTLQECKEEGLDFPGDNTPDYWDFLYFSFVIGMTSQVSDVVIKSRSLRRLALFHGVLSFFFNTSILAMTINIVAGLI